MKKIFALVLALSLVACMALSVSAESLTKEATLTEVPTTDSVTAQINLKGSDGSTGDATETVYAVDVVWAGTTFEYTYTSTSTDNVLTWNPDSHQYEVIGESASTTTGSWTDGTATVTVTNHSNDDVTATVTVADNEAGVIFTVTGGDNGASTTLEDASECAYQDYGAADSVEFTITATGAPTKSFSVEMTVALN